MTTNEKLDKLFESHGTPLSQRYDDPVARYGKDPLNKKENNIVYRQEIKKIENFIANSMKALVSMSKKSPKVPDFFGVPESGLGSSKAYILYVREDYSEFGMKLPDTFGLEGMNKAQSNFLSKPSTRRIFETNVSYWRLEPTIGEDDRLRDDEGYITIVGFNDYFVMKDLIEYYKVLDKLFNYGIVNALTKWQKAVFDLYNGINGLLGAARESYGEECSKFMYDYIRKKYPSMTWFKEEDWDM